MFPLKNSARKGIKKTSKLRISVVYREQMDSPQRVNNANIDLLWITTETVFNCHCLIMDIYIYIYHNVWDETTYPTVEV